MTIHPTITPDDGADITDAPLPVRLAWLDDRYLRSARDERLTAGLREILQVDDGGRILPVPARDPLTGEAQGAALIGGTGSGKTALLGRFLRSVEGFHPMTDGRSGNTIHVTVPPEATIKSLGETIARHAGYIGFTSKARGYDVWSVARHKMAERGVGLLVVDEAHHVLRRGSGRDVAGSLQSLKALLQGHGAVAVLLAGVPALAATLLEDGETDRRFIKLHLRPMTEGGDDARRFAAFLDACRLRVGLEEPDDPHLAARIAFACRGNLGDSVRLTKRILRTVLLSGSRRPTLDEAAATWSLHGQGGDGLCPFDPGDWKELRARLKGEGRE